MENIKFKAKQNVLTTENGVKAIFMKKMAIHTS